MTSSGNLLISEKVEFNSGEVVVEEGENPEEVGVPTETPEETPESTETPDSEESDDPTDIPVFPTEAVEELVTTNIKVSTTNGNIPWEYGFTIRGVSDNVSDVELYGYLDEEGYFVDYNTDNKNLELKTGTYNLITYNDEEITAEFMIESERDYLTNPIEILLDDEKLIIKKELYVEGVTEQSISIYWEEPWEPTDVKKYQVYLDGTLVEEITDPYITSYTYTDLLQETTYQLKVDINYQDDTVETIEAEATTIAPPVGEKVQFRDENLKTAVAEALKIYHRDVYVDDMERLSHLDASYVEIQDLTGLEHATNLEDLWLSGNEITDLTPIKDLTNLFYLDLVSNQISTIEDLAHLENLSILSLSYNELEEIDTLLELPSLTYVSLYGNYGLDFSKGSATIEVIKELHNKGVTIEWSDFGHEIFVTDLTESTVEFEINFFEIVDNISKYIIYVNGEEVAETPASEPFYKLTGLAPLTDLDITVYGVDEDGFIWGSANTYVVTPPTPSGDPVQFADPALEEAVRDALRITSRELVESDLTILTSFDATDRGITDITGLEYAINLEDLNLDSNSITNLEPLKSLTNLSYLSLINNEISDISALKNLTNLQFLALDWNHIEDIEALSGLTNLSMLSLQNNRIKDISALENLNIDFLNLAYNEITDISSLLALPYLEFVLIMNNALDLTEGSEALTIIRELEYKGVVVLYEYLDISADHVTDTEIEFSWKPVTTDGFEDFTYYVFLDREVVAEETKDTSYLLTDLEPDTSYNIEIIGFDENDEERVILGSTIITTAASVEDPGDEPGEETDHEDGKTPEEQPSDDKDEVTPPAKEAEKGIDKDNRPKETNDKYQDKKNDDKKLPTTATNSYNILLFGQLFLGAGIIAIMATRKKQA
nr:leucine-rich repeat domain-containing protein [Fredinandcohnia onubensis]